MSLRLQVKQIQIGKTVKQRNCKRFFSSVPSTKKDKILSKQQPLKITRAPAVFYHLQLDLAKSTGHETVAVGNAEIRPNQLLITSTSNLNLVT